MRSSRSAPPLEESVTERRRALKQLVAIPAVAMLAGCERSNSALTTPTASTRRYVNPPEHQPNAVYTDVIRVGQMVFVTAQVSTDEHGDLIHKGDIEGQVRQCWHNVEISMRAVGGQLTDIVQCTTHVTKFEYIDKVAEVRTQIFPVNPPTTTRPVVVNAVTGMGEDFLVSIGAIAMIS